MNKNKLPKVLSGTLASLMIFTGAGAYAAEGDYFLKTDLENVKYSNNQIRVDEIARNHVRVAPEEFVIEVGGKTYNFEKAREEYAKDPENWKENLTGEQQVEDLKVESVSAITATDVTVTFAQLAEDLEEVTVKVLDADKKEVEVKALNKIAKGSTEATFTFVKKYEGKLEGVWSVDGVEYDFADLAIVKAVNEAKTQEELWKALQDPKLKDHALVENLPEYKAELGTDNKTIDEIVKKLDEINDSEELEGKYEEVKKALEAAKGNDVKVKTILTENFEDVQDEIDAKSYADALFGQDVVFPNTMEAIQKAIDKVNETAALEAATKAVGALTTGEDGSQALAEGVNQEKIDAAKELVEKLDKDNSSKAGLLGKVEKAQKLLDEKEAAEKALEERIAKAKEEATKAIAAYEALTPEQQGIEEESPKSLKEVLDEKLAELEKGTTEEKVKAVEDATKTLNKAVGAATVKADTEAIEKAVAALTEAKTLGTEDEPVIFKDLAELKAEVEKVVGDDIEVIAVFTEAPKAGALGKAKVTLKKNQVTNENYKDNIELKLEANMKNKPVASPEKPVTKADGLVNFGGSAKFKVFGLPAEGNQVPATLAEVKAHIEETYKGVTFNADAIEIKAGEIEIKGEILSPEDWFTIKSLDGEGKPKKISSINVKRPYRITLLDNDENALLKIGMFEDGKAVLEKATSKTDDVDQYEEPTTDSEEKTDKE